MLIIKQIHLWILSFTWCFQDSSLTLAHVTSWFLKAAFSEKTNIKRLFSTPLRAGSISCFSSFWYVSTPRGVFAKPRDQQQQPFRAFLAIRLWLLSSFKLGFTDHLVVFGKLADHMVFTHLFCFQISLSDSQTLRRSSPDPCRRSWNYDGSTSCLFICVRNYFLKRSSEEKQVPSWQRESLMRWDPADPLKQLQ